MIELSNTDKKIIKFSKLHYSDKYKFDKDWITTFKPLFTEIYGWNPDEDNNYKDYLHTLFNKLLDIQLKICDDNSGSNYQLRRLFEAAFYKSFSRTQETALERVICELFGTIQNNSVLENGIERYSLDLEE